MKLLTLNLKAVGPFTDVVLDLSGGEQGLHLIYGPNEAGKTSTLRALSHLLFGFPQRSADNFVHPNEQLRIGGTLRHSSGEELEIIRRRGKRNTLRGPDDSSVVADEPGPVPGRHEPGHIRDDVRHRPRAADAGGRRNPHRSGAARRDCSSPPGPAWRA